MLEFSNFLEWTKIILFLCAFDISGSYNANIGSRFASTFGELWEKIGNYLRKSWACVIVSIYIAFGVKFFLKVSSVSFSNPIHMIFLKLHINFISFSFKLSTSMADYPKNRLWLLRLLRMIYISLLFLNRLYKFEDWGTYISSPTFYIFLN